MCDRAMKACELASLVWSMSLEKALVKLCALLEIRPGPRELARYLQVVRFRQACEHLWATRRPAGRSQAMRSLRVSLGDERPPGWPSAGGPFLGEHPAENIKPVLGAVFAGDWEDALLVRISDMPGRTSGLWLLTGNREENKARAFSALQRGGPITGVVLPSGLRQPPDRRRGDQALVLLDVRASLRLHALAGGLLPIAGAQEEWSPPALLLPGGRPLTIWAKRPSPGAFRWACSTGAGLCVSPARDELIWQLKDYLPEEWLEKCLREALPPELQLERALLAMPAQEVGPFLDQAGVTGTALSVFLLGSRDKTRERVSTLAASLAKRVELGGDHVLEKNGRWLRDDKKQGLITDAVLRLDEIVRLRTGGETFYQGAVLSQGAVLPFCAPCSELDKSALPLMEELLQTAGMTLLADAAWSKKITALARRFSPPRLREVDDVFGWRQARRAFAFPFMSIDPEEKCVKGPLESFPSQAYCPFSPTETRPPDQPPSPRTAALAALLVINFLADCYGQEKVPAVLVTRRPLNDMEELKRAGFRPAQPSEEGDSNAWQARLERFNLPVIHFAPLDELPCVLGPLALPVLPVHEAAGLCFSGGPRLILDLDGELDGAALSGLVAGYLATEAGRLADWQVNGADIRSVFKDMARWLRGLYGRPPAALAVLDLEERLSRVACLARAFLLGAARLARFSGKQIVRIEHKRIDVVLRRLAKRPGCDAEEVVQALVKTGAAVADENTLVLNQDGTERLLRGTAGLTNQETQVRKSHEPEDQQRRQEAGAGGQEVVQARQPGDQLPGG